MPDFVPVPRAEPASIPQYRGPEDHVANRVVLDMKDQILLYQPEATPFITLTGKIKGKRKAFNKRFDWLEKDVKPRKLTVNGAQTAVANPVNVVAPDGAKVVINDVIRVPRTGELMLVTATPAANAIAVTRGIGGGNQALNDGDTMVIIGSSYLDNSLMGNMRSITEFNNFNYTQIFRTPFGFTGRDIVTELYGGDDKSVETKWQAVEHKRSIEYTFWFGKRQLIAAVAGATHERTFTAGMEASIQTNVWDVSGVALNTRTFNEFLEEGLRWGKGGKLQGAGTKYLFSSSRWLTEINSWAENKLEYRVLDKTIGFGVFEYKSPHGRVMLVPTPLFDEYHPDYAFLVDLNHVDYVYLRNRDTKLLTGREANDLDGEAYEYFSDCGLQVEFEHAHSLLKGITV